MRRRIFAIALLAAALGLLSACNDSTKPDDDFKVTVRVVDTAGDPIEGASLMLVMDSGFYQDVKRADKAATGIRFTVPIASPVLLNIEDAAGGWVKTLVADTLPAGQHQVLWNGTDDAGTHQYSGLYWVRLRAGTDPEHPDFDERQPMYMALIDYDQATLGTTNAKGEMVLRDKRLFPALYGDVDMHALDENGDDMGPFPLTAATRFYVWVPGEGSNVYVRDVLRSGQVFELVWDGAPVAAAGQASAPPPARAATKSSDIPVPTTFELEAPYPNPFN